MIINSKSFHKIAFLAAAIIVMLVKSLWPVELIHYAGESEALEKKWHQALKKGKASGSEFWLGYSVTLDLEKGTYFVATTRITGCIHMASGDSFVFKGTALGELVYGKGKYESKSHADPRPAEEQVKEAAKRALEGIRNPNPRSEKTQKVKKEVAILFRFNSSDRNTPFQIRLNNLSIPFHHGNQPIHWLGRYKQGESLAHLQATYHRVKSDKSKRYLISAISSHTIRKQVAGFLKGIVQSNESEKIRAKAASEIGDQNNPADIPYLVQLAKNDHSLLVRKKAVYGLEDIRHPSVVKALETIIREANNMYIKKRAIHSMGDVGTKKAAEALKRFTFADNPTELQRSAVNAMEDLPKQMGLPYLIQVARQHPKSIVRKKAIRCLGDIKHPRAYQAIRELAESN